MTFYDILGVRFNATQDEIRKAYLDQIRVFHPDVFENKEIARIKTLQLNEAYSTLKDPNLRAKYNEQLLQDLIQQLDEQARQKQPAQPSPPQTHDPTPQHTPHPKKPSVIGTIFLSLLRYPKLVVMLVFIALYAYIEYCESESITKPVETPPPVYTPVTKYEPQEQLPFVPPVSYQNGDYVKKPSVKGVCPLEIEVKGDHIYYIYLDCLNDTQKDLAFLVDGGTTIEKDVPLGNYEIFYAVGDTWYGKARLFGANTQRYKCDGTFRFTKDSDGYNGWTLELYPQSNGNLDTDPVSASEFPA